MPSRLRAALAAALLLLAPPLLAQRGPSTPAEREKALALVELLETRPAAAEAAEARAWLMGFVAAIPDLTVKQCPSLLGSPAQRQGIGAELLSQHVFSGLAHQIRNPGAGAGSTETLTAAMAGTLRAYRAWKAADAGQSHPRLDELVALEERGGLDEYVRGAGRACL